jgi:hypothetical protein
MYLKNKLIEVGLVPLDANAPATVSVCSESGQAEAVIRRRDHHQLLPSYQN